MIEKILDKEGKVIAYCEYNILDSDGHFDNRGIYIWVNDIYITPKFQKNGMIRKLINIIAIERVPWAEYCYFKRSLKTGDKIHFYKREQIVKGDLCTYQTG